MREEMRQRLNVLAMNLDQFQSRDLAMHGFHKRALAHAACAPEQRVVGGKSAREPLGIGEQGVTRDIDALQQAKWHAIDRGDALREDADALQSLIQTALLAHTVPTSQGEATR